MLHTHYCHMLVNLVYVDFPQFQRMYLASCFKALQSLPDSWLYDTVSVSSLFSILMKIHQNFYLYQNISPTSFCMIDRFTKFYYKKNILFAFYLKTNSKYIILKIHNNILQELETLFWAIATATYLYSFKLIIRFLSSFTWCILQ